MSDVCPHGAALNGKLNAPWTGQTVTCACCNSEFGIAAAQTVNGSPPSSPVWTPANRCAVCGGTYQSEGG